MTTVAVRAQLRQGTPNARTAPGSAMGALRPRGPCKLRQANTSMARPPSRRPAQVRADVNWDAFRPQAESSFKSLVPRPSSAPGGGSVQQVDFLVIGSGIAGLSYALKVAAYGSVALVTKDFANEGCTQYAQGGVCAVLDRHDSVAEHVRDTMVAGAFLNDQQAVEVVCREGPARVLELVQMGAEFTTNADGSLHLTKEGGHTKRRVVHAADMTGREIERALLAAARANPNIRFFEHHLAIDLVVDDFQGVRHCFGADVYDQHTSAMTRFISLSTMLASGGAGQIYPNTTNPHVATGDGIAMAYRASAVISNMEFIQFHPTALWDPTNTGRTFLITEAVRGEGGMLFNKAGERFMTKYDPERLELAPRDVVARSIHNELLQRGEKHVLLDISHKPKDEVLHHFPNIAAKCLELGIDITQDPIPVVPAQHYTCGGVNTGLLGETAVQGLYACGEVACSGLHGANRLASNSLLEGLVFADRAVGTSVAHAEYALQNCGRQLHYAAASANFTGSKGPKELTPSLAAWAATRRAELREAMWRGCGIVRNMRDLRATLDVVSAITVEAKTTLDSYGINTELVELFNLATVAEITITCALQRKESRGGHYNADKPYEVDSERKPSLVSKEAKRKVAPAPGREALPVGATPNLVAPSSGVAGVGAGAAGTGGGRGGSKAAPGLMLPTKRKAAVQQRDMVARSLPDKSEP